MLNWSGIWREAWTDKINPLRAWGTLGDRLSKAYLCRAQREAKWCLECVWDVWPRGKPGCARRRCYFSGGFPTRVLGICCCGFITPHPGCECSKEESSWWLLTGAAVHSHVIWHHTCHLMDNQAFQTPSRWRDFYFMLRNHSAFMSLGVFLLLSRTPLPILVLPLKPFCNTYLWTWPLLRRLQRLAYYFECFWKLN